MCEDAFPANLRKFSRKERRMCVDSDDCGSYRSGVIERRRQGMLSGPEKKANPKTGAA